MNSVRSTGLLTDLLAYYQRPLVREIPREAGSLRQFPHEQKILCDRAIKARLRVAGVRLFRRVPSLTLGTSLGMTEKLSTILYLQHPILHDDLIIYPQSRLQKDSVQMAWN